MLQSREDIKCSQTKEEVLHTGTSVALHTQFSAKLLK